jgi:hypothetical protein
MTADLAGDLERLNALLALRYRLLWAHVRSRSGRIALLIAAYFAAACLAIVFAVGGLGAAAAAVQMGRGELVAQLFLAGVFVNATFAAVFLGIGVIPAFSDAALRRYPLSSAGRLVARHATALLEPLWLLVLTLVTGLAVGFWVSHGALLPGLPAAVLFVVTNYFVACILMVFGAWLMSTRAGPLLLITVGSGLLLVAPLAPALVARAATRPGGSIPGLTMLGLTPPFAAAAAMASRDLRSAWLGLALLAGWFIVLCVVSVVVERLPLHSHTIAGALAKWDHPCDRIAAAFGPPVAPLAGKILRYYVRSPIRYNYFVVLPAVALLMRHRGTSQALFLFALGVAPAVAFASTIPIAMNLFGFDGRGLRRYFLLPVRTAHVFRTVALVSLLPGALLLPVALVAWLIFAPIPMDGRMLTELVCAGLGGFLFLQALGLWTTLLSPRAIPFRVAFGNKLSFAANALMFVTLGILFGLPWALTTLGFEVVVRAWWMAPWILVATIAFYVATVQVGAMVFVTRREHIIALLEEGA